MVEWTLIWLPPIDGGDLEHSEIILNKFKGVYIWKHKPTNQIVYIGETGQTFYQRIYKEEINGNLKNGRWNIYDFEKEPNFAQMLRRYSFDKKDYIEVNKTEIIFIPNVPQATEIWNRCWRSRVDDYIFNLQFLFCTGDWSSDLNKRQHVESLLLWEYKQHYAEEAGLPPLTKDNDRISIGSIQNLNLNSNITFRHIGCVDSVPEKVLETLK